MQSVPLKIMMADDDLDDCEFFKDALDELSLQTQLTVVFDGMQLMQHLTNSSAALPDVIFLDINMPCKNGHECLMEIKNNERLKQIPVVIISTSMEEDMVKQFYKHGAHNYIRKPADFTDLKNIINNALMGIEQNSAQPIPEEFVIKSG